jgi:hypothetical protein
MAIHAMNILRTAGHASGDVPRVLRESGEEATGISPEPRKLYGIACAQSKRIKLWVAGQFEKVSLGG